MKRTILIVFSLAAGIASAQNDSDTAAAGDEQVDLYISVIENIDVTAEKPVVDAVDDTDTELDTILDEAEAIEGDDVEE